jgi:hypothetical protein
MKRRDALVAASQRFLRRRRSQVHVARAQILRELSKQLIAPVLALAIFVGGEERGHGQIAGETHQIQPLIGHRQLLLLQIESNLVAGIEDFLAAARGRLQGVENVFRTEDLLLRPVLPVKADDLLPRQSHQ